MNIRPQQVKSEYDSLLFSNESVADAASVVFGVKNKKIKVRRSKIKDVAKGLAEVAYSMGQTNNPEEFAEEMTENIFQAFKKASKNIDQKKKKN